MELFYYFLLIVLLLRPIPRSLFLALRESSVWWDETLLFLAYLTELVSGQINEEGAFYRL